MVYLALRFLGFYIVLALVCVGLGLIMVLFEGGGGCERSRLPRDLRRTRRWFILAAIAAPVLALVAISMDPLGEYQRAEGVVMIWVPVLVWIAWAMYKANWLESMKNTD